ncbi:hypothetical protein M758_11G069900 [Ceratodon purpureus]|uniref:Cns1/TTC4 wheel domain-containing protein n=1 Tax=Ceratodon purpureus TaxID=3225 RepID=A0A8T0GD91_CERPU|nr:hypothetical protein KC19_11G071800 [Ceratodon purpureus]KAG0600904.1 hypothetical protein M758_11G069900 [Ceratodon purpureus]
MALFMPQGTIAETDAEKADIDAIEALKESSSIEYKEEGNKFVKMGKKHYAEAVDCYTRAIDQNIRDPQHNSVCYANRAHVNLLLGNNRRAYEDAEEAIKLNQANVKAYFRGAKAALALKLIPEALNIAEKGLQIDPSNIELEKIGDKAKAIQDEEDAKKKRDLEALERSEKLATLLEGRNVKVGKATYNHLTEGRKPWVDKSAMMHWPVLFVHAEVMVSDFIEDFFEMDTFGGHLDIAYGDDAPSLVWDTRHEYTRKRVELYYLSNAGRSLSRKQVVHWLLENDVGRQFQNTNYDDDSDDYKKQRWVKVDERATLYSVLSRPDHIVSGIPVFFVIATGTSFHKTFLSGGWSLP